MNPTEQILTKVLNCRRVDLYTHERQMDDAQRRQAAQMLERFEDGEPLQYILGDVLFHDCQLNVNRHVLIPRFETEILVEHVIDIFQGVKKPRFLDLGTGSGNIAVALAKALDSAQVIAVDISKEAIQLAQENAVRNGVDHQITFCHKDMKDFLKEDHCSFLFDGVISNPPYISTKELSCLPKDVQQEPVLALDGGVDGATYYRLIVENIQTYLKPKGFCFFEIHERQGAMIQEMFQNHDSLWKTRILPDYTGVDRIFEAQQVVSHG